MWTETHDLIRCGPPHYISPMTSRRIHRAWWVAAVTFLILITSAAFRSSFGVMVIPLEEEFGWSRTAISVAVFVNLVFYGVTAPFAASLMERFGIPRIAAGSMLLIALGTGLTVVMNAAWQLAILWGVFVGLGTGALALVFGALVTNRWFASRRGLVMGIFGTAYAVGQLAFLPLISAVIQQVGWRWASMGIAIASLLLIPLIALVLRDRPSTIGLRPYGATEEVQADESSTNSTGSGWRAAQTALTTLRQACGTKAFWLLAGSFFICGWSTNGIISTHFIPAMHDHGMSGTAAASLLAIAGIFDIVGTIGSGWLTDRFNPRILLFIYYVMRGLALIALPVIVGPHADPPLLLVMIIFGLDWVATVPPTVTLCRQIYGTEKGTIVFGWVFASHMIGAAGAALVSGLIRTATGDYFFAWLLAGLLAVLAGIACMAIPTAPRSRIEKEPQPAG